MIQSAALRLYLVYDPTLCQTLTVAETIDAVVAGGITALQLRWKAASDRDVLELARFIGPRLRANGIPFIVNDRVDLALAANADGVHLGVDDLPLVDARHLTGANFILGYSPETDDQIGSASHTASYLGVGPVFSTSTKPDAGTALGPEEFRRRRNLTSLPVVGIGGISEANAESAISAGADGIAVVSAILGASDPETATRALRRAVDRAAT